MKETQKLVRNSVANLAAVAWLPLQFGTNVLDSLGETGAVMAATLIAALAVYNLAYDTGVLDQV